MSLLINPVYEQSDNQVARLQLTTDFRAKQRFGRTTAGSRGTQRRRSTWTDRHCYQRTRSEREREEKRSEYEHGAAKSVERHAEGLYADIRGYSQSGDSLRAEEKDRIEIDQAAGGIRC